MAIHKMAGAISSPGQISSDLIRVEQHVPLLVDEQTAVATDTTGVAYSSPFRVSLSSSLMRTARNAYLEASIQVTSTGFLAHVELFDIVSGVVRGFVSGFHGTADAAARVRSPSITSGLRGVARANDHILRANIASAMSGGDFRLLGATLVVDTDPSFRG